MSKLAKGDLTNDKLIAYLADEFGHYATGRPHLRSATNKKTIEQVSGSASPYPWSEVLTGAMWDVLSGMFAKYRTKPKKNTGKPPSDKEAVLWAVNRFRRVAFQPLDYLPPADVRFSDYASAVLQADKLVDPVDEDEYRVLIREVFAKRGIEFVEPEADRLNFYAYDMDRVARSRTDAYHFLHENRRQLCIPADQDISVVDLYRTDKTVMGGGKLPREMMLQYAWREDVPLDGPQFGQFNGEIASMLCGGTLVFDERGNILHWVRKPGSGAQKICAGQRRKYCSEERLKGLQRRNQFKDYIASRISAGLVGLAEGGMPGEIDAHRPLLARRASDNTLRLETIPHTRHWTED
jgi:hypothetical protein